MDLLIVEFDPSPSALITPRPPRLSEQLPPRVVLCFFPEIVAGLVATHRARRIGGFSTETGGGAILALGTGPQSDAVAHPGMGWKSRP